MIINGIVDDNIKMIENHIEYDITDNDKEYHISSYGRQAVKDAIFIKKGYRVKIEGWKDQNSILVEKAQISIGEITDEDTGKTC